MSCSLLPPSDSLSDSAIAPNLRNGANQTRSYKNGAPNLRRKIVSKSSPSVVRNGGETLTATVSSGSILTAKSIVSPSIYGGEQVITSDSSSFEQVMLIEENERLRKENMKLKTEIEDMKSLLNNIFSIMSNYAKFQAKNVAQ
ncbi:hypothetical protein RYX36_020805 [Vicia faba]